MIFGTDTGADPYVPGHGDTSFDVTHYDLGLEYDVEGNRLSGTARIDCVAREALDEVGFDLYHLEVSKATVDGKAVKYGHRRGKVTLRTNQELAAGQTFSVRLRYAGRPQAVKNRRLGTAGWEELTDGSMVAAQPHGAPSWFPCNDRPSSKATYQIRLTAPTGYRVIANGRLVRRRRRSSAITWVYEHDEPMATYLATAHIGRYEHKTLDGPVPIHAVLPPRLIDQYPSAFGRQPEMMETFIRLFGPYPFPSYTVVITDDDLEIPLEAQGLSTFGANFVRPGWDVERLVAHELSHQWFGNSLTLSHWKDIWLHEGFACYAEWLWSEHSRRRSAHQHALQHHGRLTSLSQDLALSDPGPDLMFDDRIYKRGALLLHSLRLTVGDDCFFAILQDWTRTRAHSTVNTAAFTQLASTRATTDLTELFQAWLDRESLPDLPHAP